MLSYGQRPRLHCQRGDISAEKKQDAFNAWLDLKVTETASLTSSARLESLDDSSDVFWM